MLVKIDQDRAKVLLTSLREHVKKYPLNIKFFSQIKKNCMKIQRSIIMHLKENCVITVAEGEGGGQGFSGRTYKFFFDVILQSLDEYIENIMMAME